MPEQTDNRTSIALRDGSMLRFEVTDVPVHVRRRRSGPPAETATACLVCDTTFDAPSTKRRYCSRACSNHAAKNRRRERDGLPPEPFGQVWCSECPNCGERFSLPNSRTLYCSLLCENEADLVRYFRRSRAKFGDHIPDDVRDAIKIRFAHTLGGGYDNGARRLSAATRALVSQRDRARCVLCGKPGDEVDHIDGGDNDPSNLRLLCRDCHNAITNSRIRPIDADDTETLLSRQALLLRVYAPEPLCPSDREDWSDLWRRWLAEHRVPIT